MLEDNLVWASAEGDLGSEPGAVLIVDAAAGAPAWTAQGRIPSLPGGQTTWYGVFGSTLVGGTNGVVSGDDTLGTVLFGLDAQGATAFQVTLATSGGALSNVLGVYMVYALSGQALLASVLTDGADQNMSAIDLTSGQILWSQPASEFSTLQSGTAGAQRVYLIDASAVYGFDLATGEQLWSCPWAAPRATRPTWVLCRPACCRPVEPTSDSWSPAPDTC
jgi:outer membrane protein assembly factor BamB